MRSPIFLLRAWPIVFVALALVAGGCRSHGSQGDRMMRDNDAQYGNP